MAKKQKVFWKPEEEKLLAERLLAQGFKHDSPVMFRALQKAQEALLPENRWRAIGNNGATYGVRNTMEVLEMKAALENRTEKPTVEAKPVGYVPIQDRPIFIEEMTPTPAVSMGPTTIESPLPFTISEEEKYAALGVPAPFDLGAALGQYVANAVLAAVNQEVEVIVDAMKCEIQRQLEAHLPAGVIHTPVAPVAKQHKPTVLIAGLLPMQAGLIQQEFGEVFDLRFFDASGNLQHLKDMAKVDYAFTFTSKIGHGVEEAIRAKGIQIRRCPGGMTMLREKLTALYVDEIQKEAA